VGLFCLSIQRKYGDVAIGVDVDALETQFEPQYKNVVIPKHTYTYTLCPIVFQCVCL
jgi:hypothetical protein